MEPFYQYYLVQVKSAFVANHYCESDLTRDEEEAYAFTSLAEARAYAEGVAGIVCTRRVSEQDLASIEDVQCDEVDMQQFCQALAAL